LPVLANARRAGGAVSEIRFADLLEQAGASGVAQLDRRVPPFALRLDSLTDDHLERRWPRDGGALRQHGACPADRDRRYRNHGRGRSNECAHVEREQPGIKSKRTLREHEERLTGAQSRQQLAGAGRGLERVVTLDEYAAKPGEQGAE